MQTILPVLGLVFGFIAGFGLNHYMMLYILKGENIQEILKDKTKKIWIGTLGWFIVLITMWICWQYAIYIAATYFS